MDKSTIKLYKIILACVELFFGIPVLGGTIIVSMLWAPLGILFILHLVGLILENSQNVSKIGHILGMVGNALGFVPFLGMIFHIVIGVVLLVEGIKE